MRNECKTLNPKVPFEEERKSDELFTSDVDACSGPREETFEAPMTTTRL